MKVLIALAVLLAVVGVAQAEPDTPDHDVVKRPVGQQQLSKRPYQHKVDKQEKQEGATLKNESIDKNSEAKTKSNINQISRRPYMKKASD